MDKIIRTSNVVIIWNSRRQNPRDKRVPINTIYSCYRPEDLKFGIVITPHNNGLFEIEILQARRGTAQYGKF